jgi:putative ABC transport system permease protein
MIVREFRSAWRRLILFFLCLAIGVGTIIALRSVVQSARGVIGDQARGMLAADASVHSTRAWTSETRTALARRFAEFHVEGVTESVETPTMARPAEAGKPLSKVVELRAVQAAFPYYGTVVLQSGTPYAHALLEHGGALVGPELLPDLDVKVGDAIVIGRSRFTIRGVILREPGRSMGGFSLGPRVLIDEADLPATGLLGFGSRADFDLLLKVPPVELEPLMRALRRQFRDEFMSVSSYRTAQSRVGRDFDRAENYLSLVGLIVVILGGIGVASVMRVFMRQKLRSIAILKCLGARTGQILLIYVAQVLLLGLAGSLLGVGLAGAAIALVPHWTGGAGSIFADVHYGLTWTAVAQGILIGLLVALLFSLVPLLDIRHARPASILRQETRAGGPDRVTVWTVLAVVAALVALTVWQAGSLRVGLVVCASFAGAVLALSAVGWLLIRLVQPLARVSWFPLRHAVLHLVRPGHQTGLILLAVGLGAFFIIGVRSIQASLLSELSLEMSRGNPDMFLIDVQQDQVAPLRTLLDAPGSGASEAHFIPVLRARVTAVQGQAVALGSYGAVRREGSLAREYTVTYRDTLEPNEQIVAGQFWHGPGPQPEVSIEESIHDRFHIDVGDTVRFSILGEPIDARVTSIRSVNWRDTRSGGFMFVFRPGVLDQAPHGYAVPLKGPDDPAGRARLQHAIVMEFPNVTAIDVRAILDQVQGVLDKVTLAITVVGLLVLLSGGLILIGAVAMTRFQRTYEAAILKAIGASTRAVALMLVIEYGVLGTLAGLVGAFGAMAFTWALSRYAIDLPWRPGGALPVIGLVATAVLVALVGVAASADVLRRKPLATLRAE